MRTTTNIYLFNLAVADLATLLLAMPSELYLMWKQYPWEFGEFVCDIKVFFVPYYFRPYKYLYEQVVVNETLINASILTIVAFTIERQLFSSGMNLYFLIKVSSNLPSSISELENRCGQSQKSYSTSMDFQYLISPSLGSVR